MKALLISSVLLLLIACNDAGLKTQDLIVNGVEGERIDSLITPYLNQLRELTDNTAGLAIGVTQSDRIIYARTFGFADVQHKRAVDFQTGFHLASVSKPFSAFAIAKLLQDNKLQLNDPIIKHIPEFKMQDEDYAEITIKHILNHTSGIPRNIAVDDWLNPSYGEGALEENLEILQEKSLDFKPGTQFSYSNSAYDILGILISRVSGQAFHKYVENAIFIPSDMPSTKLQKQQDEFPDNWALAYSYGITTEQWKPYPYNERLFPSSGVISSLKDMCQWGKLHLGKGTIDGKEILQKAHYEKIVSPTYDTPWGDKIGLSWFLQTYLDRPIIMHSGFDTGFESMMYIYPEEDISIVVLANRDFSRTGRIINAVSEVLFNEELKDYTISAKYKFTEVYNSEGIEKAKQMWTQLKSDTTDIYTADDDEILTTGAITENAGNSKEAKDILEFYITLNENSTYAWRLLGNANLQLGDTIAAKSCYEKTLEINPNYEKGRIALEKMEMK